MEELLDALITSAPFERLLASAGPRVARVPEGGQPYVAAALAHATEGPVMVVAPGPAEAERLARGAEAFLGRRRSVYFPAWEALPYEGISPSPEVAARRARAVHRARTSDGPFVLAAPAVAAMQAVVPTLGTTEPVRLARGVEIVQDDLLERLVALGYVRAELVEHRGEFAVRGGIVDVFPASNRRPVRLEYDGDEIESLRLFSPSTQLTTEPAPEVEVHAARELIPDAVLRERAEREASRHSGRVGDALGRIADGLAVEGMEVAAPFLFDEMPAVADLLPPGAWVVLASSRRTLDRAAAIHRDAAALAEASSWPGPPLVQELDHSFGGHSRVDLSDLAEGEELGIETWGAVAGNAEKVAAEAASLIADGFAVGLTAEGRGSLERMREVIPGAGPAAQSGAADGFVFRPGRVALVAEDDLFGRRRAVHEPSRISRRSRDAFVLDLEPGDVVVHQVHGISRFEGMVRREVAGAERDYLILAFAGTDRLYVPTDMLWAVSKYLGGEAPRLSRLGGTDWPKRTARVRRAVRDMAGELVRLYSLRMSVTGHAFSPDQPWQRELEEAFPFAETPDQMSAIDEVKRNMESSKPMDRLICGDVGYGKTEIAVRAAFKAVMDNTQVAVLVPTTLLAEQHFVTFSERYAPFPVRMAMLSRFLPPAEQRRVLDQLERGEVDVVVGTHRLLSRDAKFKNLGLLVVDEEQRFGVSHKERLKQMRASVDVLTMTATPIPRTLEMALTGVREISVVDTPPEDRQPVTTYVGPYDQSLALAAVRREMLRDGQVFWVHNRVQTIEKVPALLREQVPEARVVVAHGQMDETLLEKQMLRFWNRDADVLVCTTIIESGLDVPSANTLVVERADRLGLAQMYQLRGRVGRSRERAFAYLFFPPMRELTEEAHARLATISEHTALGSGFKIALRDLEIRGAGNLLGAEQHGHIAAVGFDTYVRLLEEAVREMRGQPVREEREVRVDLPIRAFLPVDYVGSEALRLDLYRRIASARDDEELAGIRAELEDRFGDIPEEVEGLLELIALRIAAAGLGVEEINTVRGQVRIRPIRFEGDASIVATLPGARYRKETATLNLPAALTGPALPSYVRTSLEAISPALQTVS